MTAQQIPIDWTQAVHNLENNKFSQKHLDKHRQKYTGQAAIALTLLQKGMRLNHDYARELYHIKHLARRIGDIGEKMNIYVDREHGLDKEFHQEDDLVYFLPENRQLFIQKEWIINIPFRWWYSDKYTPMEIIEEIKDRKLK